MGSKSRILSRRSDWLIPLIIFTCAFAVRMVFVMQVKDCPYWRVPMVDALTYDEAAMEMIEVSWLAPLPSVYPFYTPYFQPPLYQIFLALIYSVFGHSPVAASIIQYLIGSFCCVLTYFIGRRFFDRRTGIAAGIAMAFTASQVFYEGRLLPPVLIITLNLITILLASKQIKSPAVWRWPVIGLLIGLSAIARPDILLFVPMLLIWIWMERKTVLPARPVLWTAVLLLMIVLPIALVTARNQIVGKDFSVISYNGGINMFIGNHPAMEEMLGIRMGMRWEALVAEPMLKLGVVQLSKWNNCFYQLTFKNMVNYKRVTMHNFIRKFGWVWHGPEIRRNEDDYYLTRESSLYRLLLWRKGNFGFPFGVIAPLALLGLIASLRRRRELFLLYGYVMTQVLMLVLFFPCSRYRAPLVPILLIFAAVAAFEIIDHARRKRFGDLYPLLFTLMAFGVMSTLCPPRFEGTPRQIEAENYRLFATAVNLEGRTDEAIALCRKGLELEPDDPELHKWLFDVYEAQKDYPNAEREALECLRLVPTYGPLYTKLIEIYEAQGKYGKAEETRKLVESGRQGSLGDQ